MSERGRINIHIFGNVHIYICTSKPKSLSFLGPFADNCFTQIRNADVALPEQVAFADTNLDLNKERFTLQRAKLGKPWLEFFKTRKQLHKRARVSDRLVRNPDNDATIGDILVAVAYCSDPKNEHQYEQTALFLAAQLVSTLDASLQSIIYTKGYQKLVSLMDGDHKPERSETFRKK